MLWFSMTAAIVIYQFALGHGLPHGEDVSSPMQSPILWSAVGMVAIAAAIRWLIIPRVRSLQRVLPFLIFGLALSEAVEFFGLFLFPRDMPATKLGLFVLALLSALQFVPVYASSSADIPSLGRNR